MWLGTAIFHVWSSSTACSALILHQGADNIHIRVETTGYSGKVLIMWRKYRLQKVVYQIWYVLRWGQSTRQLWWSWKLNHKIIPMGRWFPTFKSRLHAACGDSHSFPCCACYACSNSPLACGSPITLASYIMELPLILYDGCCWHDCIIPMDSSHSGVLDWGFPGFCFVFGTFRLHSLMCLCTYLTCD